ncbi:TetR/AcrR family transcriptional regulator [Streptomyces sp. ISL-86]|uniref:TetR/AcrR family transcriptional regulator n=1 Tax=Streptomyces sp. ISL-86 TaxID=2819187 RepID=UPI001BEAE02C|nr:TetR/AcrR family transcriptional regulator [Streptomyces sp. ISL-86]MBT2453734.1 TetR/AcrR family transcriptional regulator [Streptomyces sp. ISL-86]
MPAARESLLEAAGAALSARPWPAVRMVDVAAAAGVSRQTLYNEFGGKAGLGRALIRREADWYLAGVDRALGSPAGSTVRLAAVAEWTVRAARARPLVRALLTGCWDVRLPAPPRRTAGPGGGLSGPGELARAVRDRAAAALGPGDGPADGCELVVRLALSYVIVPGEEPGLGELLGLLSAPNRTAGGR